MAAGGFIRSLRNSPVGAWLLLALTVIVPLVAMYLLALQDGPVWDKNCTLSLQFKGVVSGPCKILRISAFVGGAAGSFVLILLIWWLLSDLIGLRRIFEVPWFGVGEDVENVGVIESIVRAGLFVIFVWIAIVMCIFALLGMSGGIEMAAGKEKSAVIDPVADKLGAEAKTVAYHAYRQPRTASPPTLSPEPGRARDLKQINDSLQEILSLVANESRKLDLLGQIDGKLTRLAQDNSDALILDETKRMSVTLGDIRAGLDEQHRKLAALDRIERLLNDLDTRQMPSMVGEVAKANSVLTELQRFARLQIEALDRIERRQRQHSGSMVTYTPPENDALCLEQGDMGARDSSAAESPRRYYRSVRVFFDKSGVQPTPGALERLQKLADELKRVDGPAVSIFGSADAQGDPGLNTQYAEQRAQAVRRYLERNVPELSIRSTSMRSTEDPPSEPYNRIARVEAQGTCR
jgi:outer membrane protein OmpA-like peptidoglycan-associated protein